ACIDRWHRSTDPATLRSFHELEHFHRALRFREYEPFRFRLDFRIREAERLPLDLFVRAALPPVMPGNSRQSSGTQDFDRGSRLDVEQLLVAEVERVLLPVACGGIERRERGHLRRGRLRSLLAGERRIERDDVFLYLSDAVLL